MRHITLADIRAMRQWAADCAWKDGDDIPSMTDAEIIRGVNRHYAGGLAAFLRDCEPEALRVVRACASCGQPVNGDAQDTLCGACAEMFKRNELCALLVVDFAETAFNPQIRGQS